MTSLCRAPGHYCEGCHPEYFRNDPRPRHEGHLAVRWGDKARGRWRLFLYESDVTDRATECELGPDGYVYLEGCHDDGGARVHCPGHVCKAIVYGNVRLVPTAEAQHVAR